jgi:hypothetical protein
VNFLRTSNKYYFASTLFVKFHPDAQTVESNYICFTDSISPANKIFEIKEERFDLSGVKQLTFK